jgi:hypothetical protein
MSRAKSRQGSVRRSKAAAEEKVDKKIDKKTPERSETTIRLERDYGATHADGTPLSRKLQAVHAMHEVLAKETQVVSIEEFAKKLSKYGVTQGEIRAQAKIECGETGRKNPRWQKDKKGNLSAIDGAPKPHWRTVPEETEVKNPAEKKTRRSKSKTAAKV